MMANPPCLSRFEENLSDDLRLSHFRPEAPAHRPTTGCSGLSNAQGISRTRPLLFAAADRPFAKADIHYLQKAVEKANPR